MTIRELHKILYFFTFRFYVGSLLWLPDSRSTLQSIDMQNGVGHRSLTRDGVSEDLSASLKYDWAYYLTQRTIGALYMSILIIPLNLITGTVGIGFHKWKYGLFLLIALYVISAFFVEFDSHIDFRRFGSLSKKQSRLYAALAALVVTVIVFSLIGSTLFLFRQV